MNLREKVLLAREEFSLFSPGSGILIAASGGPDSTALLHLLAELRDPFQLTLAVAHLHHGIRGEEADRDAAFVEAQARSLGLPFYLGRADVPAYARTHRLNLEEAGRQLRYRFLEEVRAREGLDLIATGHTLSDSLETFFLFLLRGAGPRGLSGIPPKRDRVIRPLILATREEVLTYLKERNLPYRVDQTNLDLRFRRNYLRHRVFPLLAARFPGFEERAGRTLRLMGVLEDFMERQAQALLRQVQKPAPAGIRRLDTRLLAQAHRALRLWALLLLGVEGFEAARRAERWILEGGRGHLPGGLRAECTYGELVLITPTYRPPWLQAILPLPGEAAIPEANLRVLALTGDRPVPEAPDRASFPLDNLAPPLRIRSRHPGDRVGGRKLKKVFIDRKIPRWRRDWYPIFEDRAGIFWVPSIWRREGQKGNKYANLLLKKDHEGFWFLDP